MWKFLHPYAKPETQYRLLGKIQPTLGWLSLILLVVGFIWGLAFAPKDYQQGDSYRIIFIHVPAAIWSMGVYGSMALAGLVALVWQIRQANLAMISIGTYRTGLCVYFVSNRCNLGQTNVGNLVGMGCSLNLCFSALFLIYWCDGAIFSFPR